MPRERFNPTPAEQFSDEGLPSFIDQSETPDTLAKKRKTGVLGKEMIGSEGSKSGFKHDYEDVELAPNTDSEGKEIGESHIIDLIDAKQKKDERKRLLREGKAVLIRKPDDGEKEEDQEKGDRVFNTVGELMEFREKREKAMDKARVRHSAEQEKRGSRKEKKVTK